MSSYSWFRILTVTGMYNTETIYKRIHLLGTDSKARLLREYGSKVCSVAGFNYKLQTTWPSKPLCLCSFFEGKCRLLLVKCIL